MEIARQMKERNLGFAVFIGALFIAYFAPLRSLLSFAWNDDTFSYIPLVPLVSAFFLYEKRKEIFPAREGLYLPAGAPIVVGTVMYLVGLGQVTHLTPVDQLTVMSLSLVFCVMGGLGLFHGPSAWRAAAFPMFFLLFMVPIPKFLLDRIVYFLQVASTEASAIFFGLTGVPMYRDGFVFHLPGLSIEVARECSGIRSSLSLFLVSLLAGHLVLRDTWRKAVLILSIVPIAIVKNAVRIVTLSLVAVYVDPRILGSVAHRRGGIPIFLLALVLLGAVLWALRRGEKKGSER